jgi:hypothetical protein
VFVLKRAGIASLKLHPGRAPHWLVKRMIPMASALCEFIVDEFGSKELLKRLADPVWFQALSNVLGWDFDSSGSTTVTCGVLRCALNFQDHNMIGVGGKGLISRSVPQKLIALEDFGLDGSGLAEISKNVAKVDSAALQDGYQLYHHLFFVDTEENWTVVQQGMDSKSNDARRYHWTSDETESFIEEPHTGLISGNVQNATLDMTSKKSNDCRKTSVDISKEEPLRIKRMFEDIKPYGESSLVPWLDGSGPAGALPSYKVVPKRMDWNAVRKAYETQPSNFEQLLFLNGVGPATVRGLALIAEMIYGSAPSWADPVRMTFAFGGKDGVPFPVPRKAYDKAIEFMEQAINEAKMGRKDKVWGLKRLRKFAPPILVTQGNGA